MSCIPIIIPAYEPDERMIALFEGLAERAMGPVVLVDDGSGEAYADLFVRAQQIMGDAGTLLVHEVNRGKGAALKTAFSHVLETWPEAIGVVTADSDGQHVPDCIERVRAALTAYKDSLVMGVRTFDGDDVPWKSRMGNKITSHVLLALTGLSISDTQTGLRGIPRDLLEKCLDLPGDRFEFETQMLTAAQGTTPIIEVPIATVYDSKENHQTHFNTVKDSWRIYRTLLRQPLAYALSSITSCATDLAAFAVLCRLLENMDGYVAISTVIARLMSATLNYTLNSRVVFRSKRKDTVSIPRYVGLAVVIMAASATFTTLGTLALPMVPEVAVKAVVDCLLFIVSYLVQRQFVF
ncbi:MAG: bifunctional glycosyltransferase family 2/GtrA family protein [Atopobiaceae bacterium]|nr:bifunctional glycosyltransferase family 2/GtrA family protein [Atopobiaceae bacterium]